MVGSSVLTEFGGVSSHGDPIRVQCWFKSVVLLHRRSSKHNNMTTYFWERPPLSGAGINLLFNTFLCLIDPEDLFLRTRTVRLSNPLPKIPNIIEYCCNLINLPKSTWQEPFQLSRFFEKSNSATISLDWKGISDQCGNGKCSYASTGTFEIAALTFYHTDQIQSHSKFSQGRQGLIWRQSSWHV